MSALAELLSTLTEARAERVFFAPGEVGQAFEGDESRPLKGGPLAPSTLAAAVSELLSQDEMRALPSSRPRIVRHEHDGADYVIEVVRQAGGVAIGVRRAKTTLRRDPGEPAREALRDSVRRASIDPEPLGGVVKRQAPSTAPPPPEPPPPPKAAEPEDGSARRGSRRFRAPREKHTIRVELDDEGNPIDSTAVDLDVIMPGASAEPARRSSKGFKRPTVKLTQVGDRVYETRMVPRAGVLATNTEIAGNPGGAYVTFLFAPSGFSLVMEGEGAVVITKSDDAAIRGELFVGPSMKLRIAQGPKESLVTFYRRLPPA